MRLLFLCHRIPYPPDKGDKIRSYHELAWLAERHEVDLFTLVDDEADRRHVEPLRELVEELTVIRLRPIHARLRALKACFVGQALTVAHFDEPALRRALEDSVARRKYDLCFVFSSNMAPLVRNLGVPLALDFVDVDSAKFAAYASGASLVARPVFAREARRLRALERELCESAELTIVCTDRERIELESFAHPKRLEVIENGVDIEYFHPAATRGEDGVVFAGAMDYRANVDAVLWFAREVWPLVRARHETTRFTIVGSNPAPSVLELNGRNGIEVTGRVPDVRPFVTRAAVSVAPLQVARGIQNKVLEALACGLPVVATRAALGGLSTDPRGVVVAESATDFAAAVSSLLLDPARRHFLSTAGRDYVVENHRWEKSLDRLESLLLEVSSSTRARTVEESVSRTSET